MLFHDQLGLACLFVDFALGRDPFDEVFVFDVARTFANDRDVVLFPNGDLGLFLDFGAVGEQDARSELDVECLQRLDRFGAEQFFVLFQRSPFIADDVERAVLVERKPDPFFVLHRAEVHVDEDAVLFGDKFRADAADAIPPKWNVRIVSCVPGSPIDCAAMIPTASPMPTTLPLARLMP